MPHEVLTIVLKLVENSSPDQSKAAAEAWKLVVMWCVMAAQADQQGDSLVAFAVDAVMENNDAYFGQWVENRLDSTMGKQPAANDGMGATMVATPVPRARSGAVCSGAWQRVDHGPSRIGLVQNTINDARGGI